MLVLGAMLVYTAMLLGGEMRYVDAASGGGMGKFSRS